MTSFEGTRAAAARAAGAASRVADAVRVGAEQQAQQIRDARDRQSMTERRAFDTVQGLQSQVASVEFNNSYRAAGAKAQADNAIGELINNLGATFVATARRAVEAQADANIAEQKVALRQAGSGAALTGESRDASQPRAYQDAYTESAASLAATQAVTRFQTEFLPSIADPMEARQAAHKFLARETHGMEDPAYREYFSRGFLNVAVDAAAKHEAQLVKTAQLHAQDTAIAGASAKLAGIRDATELNDLVETAVSVFQPADRMSARPTVIRNLLARASETDSTNKLLGMMTDLGWDTMYGEAFKGFYKEARVEARAAFEKGVKARLSDTGPNGFATIVGRLEASADAPDQTFLADLGTALGELKTIDAAGGSTVPGFADAFNRLNKLQAKWVDKAPDFAAYMDFRAARGNFNPKTQSVYADREAAGMLSALEDASASGDAKAYGAAIGAMRDFVSSTNGYIPKPLAARIGGIFDGVDITKISDPQQQAQALRGREETLGIMLDAFRNTPSLMFDIKDSVSGDQALFLRMAFDRVNVDHMKPGQALMDIYRQYPSDVRKAMAAVDPDKVYSTLRVRQSFDAYGAINDAMDDLDILDPAARKRFRAEVGDYIRLASEGGPEEGYSTDQFDKALGNAKRVFEAGSVELPVADENGDRSMGRVFVMNPQLRAQLRAGHLGQSAGEVISGWLDDTETVLRDYGVGGTLSLQPSTNGDDSFALSINGSQGSVMFDGTDATNGARLEAMANSLKALNVPVKLVSLAGGSMIEMRLSWDSNVLAANRQEAIKQQAERAAARSPASRQARMADEVAAAEASGNRYGSTLIEGAAQAMGSGGPDIAGAIADSVPQVELFNGFIRFGNPPLPEGEQTTVTDLMPGPSPTADIMPQRPGLSWPTTGSPMPVTSEGGTPLPTVEGGSPSNIDAAPGDSTIPFLAPDGATEGGSPVPTSEVTPPVRTSSVKTVAMAAKEAQADAMHSVGEMAVSHLQDLGVVSKTIGLTKPMPKFDSFPSILEFLDRAVEDYQIKQNGGIPVDRKDAPVDQTYVAIRKKALHTNEGYKRKAYLDTEGKWTIGAGINLDEPANRRFMEKSGMNPDAVIAGTQQLTDQQLDILFDFAVAEAEKVVSSRIKVALTPNQRAALVSLAYNHPSLIGMNLTRFVNSKDWVKAEEEIRKHSNLRKHRGLQNRRNREADLFAQDTHDPAEPFYHS